MFEQTVLQQIGHLLKEGDTAEFHNGTLFVCSSRPTGNEVYIELCNIYRKRFVQFNIVAENEYAFDFIKG
jgi:hypothetical protein